MMVLRIYRQNSLINAIAKKYAKKLGGVIGGSKKRETRKQRNKIIIHPTIDTNAHKRNTF